MRKVIIILINFFLLTGSMIPLIFAETEQHLQQPLSLEHAINFSLHNNHSIKKLHQDIGIAGDRVSASMSAFLPHLSAEYSYRWMDNAPGMNTEMGPFIVSEEETQAANLTLMMNVWDFGRSLGSYDQAKLGRDMVNLSLERLKHDVTFQVTKSYFQILRAKKSKLIAEESLAQVKSHLKVANSFFKQGIVDKNDILTAELHVTEVEHGLILANNYINLTVTSLNMALGIDPNCSTEVIDIKDVSPFKITFNECLDLAMSNRPELLLIRNNIALKEAGLVVAKSARYPRIYLGGGYNRMEDDYQLHKDIWTATIGMKFDLFSGGKTSADIHIAEKQIRKAEETAKEVRDGIVLQTKSAFLTATEALERMDVMEKAIEQAEENLRLMNNKYKYNIATSTDVVDADALLTRVRSDYYSAIYDYKIAVAQLENAVGRKLGKEILNSGSPVQDCGGVR